MLPTSAIFKDVSQNADGFISLSEIISALSYALDLTEGAAHGHALRSCLLGMRIASETGLSADHTSSLYFALLLKDIGCSSSATRMHQIVGGDERAVKAGVKYEDWTNPYAATFSTLRVLWEHVLPESGPAARIGRILRIGATQNRNNAEIIGLRSKRGASIIAKLGMGDVAAQAVRSIDERWDGGGFPDSAKGEQIPVAARICAVAQHLDVFASRRGIEKAIGALEQRSGTWFDPELVRVAVSLHRRGRLWTNCLSTDDPGETRRAVLDLDSGRQHRLEPGQIDQICEAFADVVDAKSHFTFRHSIGVAEAAYGIAGAMGLSQERVQLVRRAALLHDIGKLGIPNTILDKRSRLNPKEWQLVHQHPVLSQRILERVRPFGEIAVIAGEHHEKLDGSGYPHRLSAKDLSLESRIVAVADVYGALMEDRPYRQGLGFGEIITIMSKLVPNQLDEHCFEALVSSIWSNRYVRPVPARQVADLSLEYAFESAM